MSISIVIPTYNAEAHLGQTLDSVLAQTVADWELVLVDDGSTDGTVDVARAYADRDRRFRIVLQENRGTALARNRGLAEATGRSDYIVFLDHDDLWERDALETLLRELQADPEAVAASGLSRVVDERSNPTEPGELEVWGRRRQGVVGGRVVPWPVHAPTTFAVLAYRNCIATPGQVLIRWEALPAAGAFDPAASPCDDWDLWLRLSQRGPIAFVDRVVLGWRRHGGNASGEWTRMSRQVAYVRRKLLSSSELSAEQRRTAYVANGFWGGQVCSMRFRWARERLAQRELRAAAQQLTLALVDCIRCIRGNPVEPPVFRPTLKQLYTAACLTPSDINEHLGTLFRLARRCRHVTEFGTRGGTSTLALLCAGPKRLISYDKSRLGQVALLESVSKESGRTCFSFRQQDVLDAQIEETDMLFIDTWHVYEQLMQELAMHARKVRKFLVFHDTTTYGEVGEAPGHLGLWPAIEEFLRDRPEWKLTARLMNNNGLTVLTRVGSPVRTVASAKGRQPVLR